MKKIVDEKQFFETLQRNSYPSDEEVLRVLDKGLIKKGLSLDEVAVLISANKPRWVQRIFKVASKIKEEIYGERLVFFAPLYISDYCANDCKYCNFHKSNDGLARRKLSTDEIKKETKCLLDMGHKRALVEFGEDPELVDIDYICDAIKAIYSVNTDKGNIRRINVNIAATTTEDYKRLKACDIGTYQLFQETYHRQTYEAVHSGPKADYDRQLTAHVRAFEAGIDDLGIGVLFGLFDWRFEVLALTQHAKWMDENLGVGPHTISVPRFCPAPTVNYKPQYPVSDEDFLRIIAILRIAVPYTGMILSTREEAALRGMAFKLGISQASAASVTTTGGYIKNRDELSRTTNDKRQTTNHPQFKIHDTRPLHEVIRSVVEDNLIPSFCTACYRRGRTGSAFMKLAKVGDIHHLCRPNALLTFAEYIEDYADKELKKKGNILIEHYLSEINNEKLRQETKARLDDIRTGKRDLFF